MEFREKKLWTNNPDLAKELYPVFEHLNNMCVATLLTKISRTLAVVNIKDEFSNTLKDFRFSKTKSVTQNRKNHQIVSSNSDDLLV